MIDQIVMGCRRSGRTQYLMELMRKYGPITDMTVLTSNAQEADRLWRAYGQHMDGVTKDQFVAPGYLSNLRGRTVEHLLVDDADVILEHMIGHQIMAATFESGGGSVQRLLSPPIR